MLEWVLELRKYKNDSTEPKNPLNLKLPHFSFGYAVREKARQNRRNESLIQFYFILVNDANLIPTIKVKKLSFGNKTTLIWKSISQNRIILSFTNIDCTLDIII